MSLRPFTDLDFYRDDTLTSTEQDQLHILLMLTRAQQRVEQALADLSSISSTNFTEFGIYLNLSRTSHALDECITNRKASIHGRP